MQGAREWLSFSAGGLKRAVGVLDDSPAHQLQGGYAFSYGSLRPGIELGFGTLEV